MNYRDIKQYDCPTEPEGYTTFTRDDLEYLIHRAETASSRLGGIMINLEFSFNCLLDSKIDYEEYKDAKGSSKRIGNECIKVKKKISIENSKKAEDAAIKLDYKTIDEEDIKYYKSIMKYLEETKNELKKYSFSNKEIDIIKRLTGTIFIINNKLNLYKTEILDKEH